MVETFYCNNDCINRYSCEEIQKLVIENKFSAQFFIKNLIQPAYDSLANDMAELISLNQTYNCNTSCDPFSFWFGNQKYSILDFWEFNNIPGKPIIVDSALYIHKNLEHKASKVVEFYNKFIKDYDYLCNATHQRFMYLKRVPLQTFIDETTISFWYLFKPYEPEDIPKKIYELSDQQKKYENILNFYQGFKLLGL